MQLRIAGVGFSHELEFNEGDTLGIVLGEANIEAANLVARVNGETVDLADTPALDGQTVVLAPPDVKLGA